MALTTYDQSTVVYDRGRITYDGVVLRDEITLLINGADVTDWLADRGLSVSVNTHGNSLGTLDAMLIDPQVSVDMDDEVVLYIGTTRRYLGWVKSIEVNEYRGGHLWVSIGCQDEGPEDGVLPTPAPFELTDSPDGSPNKVPYESLRKTVSQTEGGQNKTTYEVVVGRDGLWIDQNVKITAANYGLRETELTIKKAQVSWRTPDSPQYSLELGDPLVSLAQIIAEGDFTIIPDGSITETKISDGAISTPKLAANAVTAEKIEAGAIETEHLASDVVVANVANVGETVVIDSDGITVTDGKITVENDSGFVIIDGTSSLFRIVASGLLSAPSSSTPGETSNAVDLSTGLTYNPVGLFYVNLGGSLSGAQPTPWALGNTANGDVLDMWYGRTTVTDTNKTRVRVFNWTTRSTSKPSYQYRYYVMKEEAI